jgi:cytochrome P450
MKLEDINLCDLSQFEQGCPHALFARLRREAPVWHHPRNADTPDAEGFWVISNNADARAILKDHARFSSETGRGAREGGGTTLFDLGTDMAVGNVLSMMDPPKHDDIRGLVNQGFFPRTLALMENRARELAREILEKLEVPGEVDFLNDVAVQMPLYMICTIAGLPREDWHLMPGWAAAAIEISANDPESDRDALIATLTDMAGYAFTLIERLRAEPDDSIFSQVIHATIPGKDGEPRALDEMELVSFFNLLITGGVETTSNAISAGLHTLLSHPEQFEALRRDFDGLAPNAVDEILRFTAPVHFNRRTASEDIEYQGKVIKRGEKVTVWYPSANRDEAVFDDPDRFDIHRGNASKHLSFGYGIHHCLGAALARMEIRIILDEFIRMFGARDLQPVGALRYIRSNRHQGVAEARISIR